MIIKTFKEFLIEEITRDELYSLYELNYMYDMMRNSPFNGIPKRRENLIRNIEIKSEEVCNNVIEDLVEVFNKWLDSHALTAPEKWAVARVNELIEYSDFSEILDAIAWEYWKYAYPNAKYNDSPNIAEVKKEILSKYLNLIEEEKISNNAIERYLYKIAQDEIDFYTSEIENSENDEDISEYKERIEELQNNDYTSLMDIVTADALNEANIDDEYQFFIDLNIYIVFPMWYKKWSAEGIDKTREVIEDINEEMKKAYQKGDIRDKFKIINIALNATHQTGSMLDYVQHESSDVTKQLLDELSNLDVSKLNSELKMKGFNVNSSDK